MNDYTEVRLDLNPCTETHTDILAAMLAEVGYESFVPDSTGLTTYIRKEDFSPTNLDHVIREFPMDTAISPSHTIVEGQDWNYEWEKNYFKPIVIDELCAIHSSFHKDVPECKYDILIDPKMAFGTGHHATTTLILRRLLAMELVGKKVVDMGTGTGILAILADMRGATRIDAVEIDEFAYENAKENMKLNGAEHVTLHHGDATTLTAIHNVDMFIANINRNIITTDLAAYAGTLASGASVVLSGFYKEDIPVIMEVAETLGLTYADHTVLDRWASLHLKYQEA